MVCKKDGIKYFTLNCNCKKVLHKNTTAEKFNEIRNILYCEKWTVSYDLINFHPNSSIRYAAKLNTSNKCVCSK